MSFHNAKANQSNPVIQKLVYALAMLEADELERVRVLCVKYRETDEREELVSIEEEVEMYCDSRQVGRVAKAYGVLTGTEPHKVRRASR